MHCVSTYPANINDLNLSMILKLKKYKCPIGYIDMKIVFHLQLLLI